MDDEDLCNCGWPHCYYRDEVESTQEEAGVVTES